MVSNFVVWSGLPIENFHEENDRGVIGVTCGLRRADAGMSDPSYFLSEISGTGVIHDCFSLGASVSGCSLIPIASLPSVEGKR